MFFRFDVVVSAPRLTHWPTTLCPMNPSCDLLAYPRNTLAVISPWIRHSGPMTEARTKPPSTLERAPTNTGPSSRVPWRTSTPASRTTTPCRTSNTTPGSTAAPITITSAGSPRTMLPSGTPVEGAPRKSTQSSARNRSSALTTS